MAITIGSISVTRSKDPLKQKSPWYCAWREYEPHKPPRPRRAFFATEADATVARDLLLAKAGDAAKPVPVAPVDTSTAITAATPVRLYLPTWLARDIEP